MENSDFVRINHEHLLTFSKKFNANKVKHWLSVAPFDFANLNEEEKLHFVFILNALSFCYWGEPKWTVKYEDAKCDGAWGMILALNRAIKKNKKILNFSYCSKLSKTELVNILKGNTEIPLLEERWKILQELSKTMLTHFNGKASALISLSHGDAQNLLALIVKVFPSFSDTATYKGRKIYFYKRAQLLVADIYQLFNGQGVGTLKNVNYLTACADYKLPQILRKLQILEYTKELAEKVDTKIEIFHNSREEIEIRANTIWAVEFIKNIIKSKHPKINSFEINDYLWLATQKKFTNDKPYHRTRTIAY